ncbi:MAG: amino acid racemase [Patescibacteria group bacterium]
MKTVGIIGGLGPEATAKFYLEIVSACSNRGEQTHPPILIYSVPLPLQIEKECIINGQSEEKCVPFLIQAAKTLEQGGADFLVMPCNSLHVFIEEIRKAVKIPVLSIVEETIKFLKNHNIKQVGILATSITINRGLYKSQLNTQGIIEVIPNDKDQTKLGQIIYNLVIGKYTDEDKQIFDEITENLVNKEVESIILACTDLQLLAPRHTKIAIYDTMQILVDATVREIIK